MRATRAEVVEAARRLFLERGYGATTIEAIGQAASDRYERWLARTLCAVLLAPSEGR